MEYRNLSRAFYTINIFDDPDFTNIIKSNSQVDDDSWVMRNIIIKYFNDEEITLDYLKNLKHIDYAQNKELFYLIPMVIFCIDKTVEGLMSETSS
jgi:hypothetical protein